MTNIDQIIAALPAERQEKIAARTAELFAIRKMRPTVGELRALADRFADAVQLMQISAMNEHLPGIRSAHLSLHDIVRQTEFLNVGIAHAIEAIQQESKS